MKDRIQFYNSMSLYERYLFRRLCRMERKKAKAGRNLEKRIETIEELLDDVEQTIN